jgi:hypothetical protein
VALTVNPVSPHGPDADPRALLDAVRQAFPTLPVIDVVGG